MNLYKRLVRPILFQVSADYAHELTIETASYINNQNWATSLLEKVYSIKDPRLYQKIWGLKFQNPVGLAAGFDKNATAPALLESIGFGFLEIGSITANANTGNPKPRSFRLIKDLSLINRLGLNNDGAKTVVKRLKNRTSDGVPIGINIAKTHNPQIYGQAALDDYAFSFNLAKDIADYITINISCPNTKEGKTFENPDTLDKLLSFLNVGKDASDPPVLIKLSADLEEKELTEVLSVAESYAVSGYVATNTSTVRNNLRTTPEELKSIGKGGLSGKAITSKSTELIRRIHQHTKGEKTIIGVGGIFSARDAIVKLKAGADLLQIYTGMVYEGPSIVKKINKGIVAYLEKHELKHVYQI